MIHVKIIKEKVNIKVPQSGGDELRIYLGKTERLYTP